MSAAATTGAERAHARPLVRYDVLLLHGTPVELTASLPAGIDEGEPVELRGEKWTVAAVRARPQRPQLVCVRGL